MKYLASLTTLTYLELNDVDCERGGEALRALSGLQKMRLVACNNIELDLFVPGSFPNLRALHFEEDPSRCDRSFPEDYERPPLSGPYYLDVAEERVSKAKEAILGLRSLRELSGDPFVFHGWFGEGQTQWQVANREGYVIWQKV